MPVNGAHIYLHPGRDGEQADSTVLLFDSVGMDHRVGVLYNTTSVAADVVQALV